MTITHTAILLSLTLLVFGCEDSEVSKHDTQERHGKIYLPNTQEPYTGTVKTIHSQVGEGFSDTASTTQYVDGLKHGEHVSFHTNEQVNSKGNYTDGKKDGPWVAYRTNGQAYGKGTFKYGSGLWVEHYEDGSVSSKTKYKIKCIFDVSKFILYVETLG